ncbi:hypothetical protein AXK11_05815 [Cephaloticoccus primus]|uniref:Uncharacterized protein n=1 Tax=Cephaloticoccus primus TaxID=1548207 RepID=A0A139SMC6_9BACT|nr:hypothetical protein [Cephaloticoccus primus]KXU35634.1 hypothetical protein AXK11_05815 [Cephaloticoccus primus]
MSRQPAPEKPAPVVCEIRSSHASEAGILSEIAKTCARELAQPLLVKTVPSGQRAQDPLITLQLPVEMAATQHEVWCLACRLACFCPSARVSVFVSATELFTKTKAKSTTGTAAPKRRPSRPARSSHSNRQRKAA